MEMPKTKAEVDSLIKGMINAECSILGCKNKQFFHLSLPTKTKGISAVYPFCEKHSMGIMTHEIKRFQLKNGNIYG